MSFEVTALGHQGWLVSTATTRILIDPLLTPGFGHGGLVGAVYPPRAFDFARLPPIDAVVVTHEHDDHFDIASLSRVDRRIPVYLSCRSSTAAHAALTRMGFAVRRLPVGAMLECGDLQYRTFAPDHIARAQGDEWDVAPFVLRQRGDAAWFASSIDVAMPPALVEDLARSGHRGICVLAHNTTSANAFDATPGRVHSRTDDTALLARVLARRIEALVSGGCLLAGVLLSGGGWAFEGSRAWLNARVFPVDPTALAREVEVAGKKTSSTVWVQAPLPGARVCVGTADLVAQEEPAAFLRPLPRAQWPDRTPADGPGLGAYAPACGRRTLAPPERLELLDGLGDFARYLYGTALFGQLHSLPGDGSPQVALRLLDTQEAWTLAYVPNACAFRSVACGDPIPAYRSGLECWATDLHALFTGRIAPSALCYAGRLRTWNHDPTKLRVSPHLLWMMAHPLRRPTASAALYASLAQRNRDAPIEVRAPGRT